jgi:hypothetical protein
MVKSTTETYIPKKECRRCGTRLRYVRGRTCVHCTRTHSQDYYAAHPEKKIIYLAKRAEKKRLARAREKQLRAMGILPPKPKKPKPIKGTWKSKEVPDMMQAIVTGGVVGTMHINESADTVKIGGGIGTLQEIYVAALLRRDAAIWNRHRTFISMQSEDDGDVLGSHQNFTAPYKGSAVITSTVKKIEHRETACPKCNGHEFYKSNGSCAQCLRLKNKAIKQAKKAAAKAAKIIELRPGLRATQIKSVKIVPAKIEPEFMRSPEKISAHSARQARWSDR